MKSNILSLGQLLKKGYDICLKDNNLSIRDSASNLIVKVSMSGNRMFVLNIQNNVLRCVAVMHLGFGIFDLGISILEDWSYSPRRK